MVELRVVGPGDWPVWREMRLAALADAPYAFGARLTDWQGPNDREERWRNRLATPGARSFVAYVDGRPVGMAAGIPGDEERVVALVSMWVRPEARGRGVGDALIRAVEGWACSVNAREVHLAVADGNTAAATLYERNGYVRTDAQPKRVSGGSRCEYVMAKPL